MQNASPVCTCMQGFRPKNQEAWNLRDGSDGCVRNTGLNCSTDKFLHLENMKLPETSSVFMNMSITLDECGSLCKRNCSCTAYANIDIRNGETGYVMWIGQLFDMNVYHTDGQDLYLRLAAADIGISLFIYYLSPNEVL
ncbi:S-locus-specific glycoprotein S13 isoform X1 [Arachis ipaensis]|uniref:S-locus-specific glycoprotein S13 isoform X1 n=2 Tax=Arachis ipaensis TaxID=130454 RepID=UPI000A2B4DD3|nr:S-locus-specific glycoprotein S13 isoform X1 [Arachis ipaensis]